MAKLRLSDPSTRDIRRSFEKGKSDKISSRIGGGAAAGGGGSEGVGLTSLAEMSSESSIPRNRREERAKKAAKTIDALHDSVTPTRTPRIDEEDLLVAEFSDAEEADKKGLNP